MPPIFSYADKVRIRKELLKAGFVLVKEKGIRKTSVDEVTERVGIAKGTFYHFFPSKQIFFMEMIRDYRDKRVRELEQSMEETGELQVDWLMEWYQSMLNEEENPLYFMTPQDAQWMRDKLPQKFIYDEEGDLQMAKLLLSKVKGVRRDINYGVVANFPKMIFLAVEHKEELHSRVLEQNIQMIVELMKKYIMGENI